MDNTPLPTPRARDLHLVRSLARLRWIIITAALAITLVQPSIGRTGQPLWPLIVAFALYNLIVELVRGRSTGLQSFRWVPATDLIMAGTLYFLDAEPGGPLFVMFYLIVISAAVTMSLRGIIVYTATVVVTIVGIAPTLPFWSPTPWEIRDLGSRLIVITLVGIGTSIMTRRIALEQDARRLIRDEATRLEELDKLRARFISTISHDLRTPLTAIQASLGMLEASAAERLQEAERELLGNARRNVERLGMFIDDLLALNQLDAGALELECEPIDLRAVVTGAMSTVHPLLRQKGQRLEVDLPAALPVEGDARRLEQVLVNLLANVHHHTPSGTRVAIAGEAANGEIRLSVADDGPGIPPEEHEAIFRRFYRRASTSGGSGLGLEIAKSLVELHRGRVWLESVPGRGTSFHVSLPRRAKQEPNEP